MIIIRPGGFGQIVEDLMKECPNSQVLTCIAVNGKAVPEEVLKCLESIGLNINKH